MQGFYSSNLIKNIIQYGARANASTPAEILLRQPATQNDKFTMGARKDYEKRQ